MPQTAGTNIKPSIFTKSTKGIKEDGINLCSSGIEQFKLSAEEKAFVSKDVKENMVLVNCLLYLKCGIPLENSKLCTKHLI